MKTYHNFLSQQNVYAWWVVYWPLVETIALNISEPKRIRGNSFILILIKLIIEPERNMLKMLKYPEKYYLIAKFNALTSVYPLPEAAARYSERPALAVFDLSYRKR